jgi:hypothetical protein
MVTNFRFNKFSNNVLSALGKEREFYVGRGDSRLPIPILLFPFSFVLEIQSSKRFNIAVSKFISPEEYV